jgi:hypothetical protein
VPPLPGSTSALLAAAVNVRTELALLAPGVIAAGENEQLKVAGKPEQLSVIGSSNVVCGTAVTVTLPAVPADIVIADGSVAKARGPFELVVHVDA